MSTPPSSPRQVEMEDEDWLPQDFQPMGFKQLVVSKLKNAPLVGVGPSDPFPHRNSLIKIPPGIAATLGSLVMAAYQMRLGNSSRFNYWLRWRVGAQVFTIGTFIWYGGVAFTREQQDQYMTKTMILLGDLPRNHPTTGSHPVPPRSEQEYSDNGTSTEEDNYPRAVEDRMRASDFAKRLRQAEIAQRKEDEAKAMARERKDAGGVQAVTGPGEFLRRRMERETERKEGAAKERTEKET